MITFLTHKQLIGIALLFFIFGIAKAQNPSNSVIIDKNYNEAAADQALIINSASIEGDILWVDVTFCKKCDYESGCLILVSNGLFEESYPPKMEVRLVQKKLKKCKKK